MYVVTDFLTKKSVLLALAAMLWVCRAQVILGVHCDCQILDMVCVLGMNDPWNLYYIN